MSRFRCNKDIEKTCQLCGGCCHFKELSFYSAEEEFKAKASIFNTTFIFYIYPFDRYTITITPHEKDILESVAKENNITLKIIPKKIIYDQAKDIFYIIDYSLDSAICPFLCADNRCLIYGSRPEICKRFPDIGYSREFLDVKQLIKKENITRPTLSLKEVTDLFFKRNICAV